MCLDVDIVSIPRIVLDKLHLFVDRLVVIIHRHGKELKDVMVHTFPRRFVLLLVSMTIFCALVVEEFAAMESEIIMNEVATG